MISQHENMQWQWQWGGAGLINTKVLVSPDELDIPQRQLGSIMLVPDPPPIINARPEQYYIDENTQRQTMDGVVRLQMDGTARIESNSQSGYSQ
jgi:hypothetical protein